MILKLSKTYDLKRILLDLSCEDFAFYEIRRGGSPLRHKDTKKNINPRFSLVSWCLSGNFKIHIALLNIFKSNYIWYKIILKTNTKNDEKKGLLK